MSKKKTKSPHCRLCATAVQKRGDICREHQQIISLGLKMRDSGIEVRQRVEESPDLNGFTEYMIAFAPLLKISAPHLHTPQAVKVGDGWFAKVDKDHSLHQYFENMFTDLGKK